MLYCRDAINNIDFSEELYSVISILNNSICCIFFKSVCKSVIKFDIAPSIYFTQIPIWVIGRICAIMIT